MEAHASPSLWQGKKAGTPQSNPCFIYLSVYPATHLFTLHSNIVALGWHQEEKVKLIRGPSPVGSRLPWPWGEGHI